MAWGSVSLLLTSKINYQSIKILRGFLNFQVWSLVSFRHLNRRCTFWKWICKIHFFIDSIHLCLLSAIDHGQNMRLLDQFGWWFINIWALKLIDELKWNQCENIFTTKNCPFESHMITRYCSFCLLWWTFVQTVDFQLYYRFFFLKLFKLNTPFKPKCTFISTFMFYFLFCWKSDQALSLVRDILLKGWWSWRVGQTHQNKK